MTLTEAKAFLGDRWLLHPHYKPQPQHSPHRAVNVAETFRVARERMAPAGLIVPRSIRRVK